MADLGAVRAVVLAAFGGNVKIAINSLSIQGALAAADSAKLDMRSDQSVALKTLAHEFRKLRRDYELQRALITGKYPYQVTA